MCPGGTALRKPDPFQSFDFVIRVETPFLCFFRSDVLGHTWHRVEDEAKGGSNLRKHQSQKVSGDGA